MKRFVLGVVLMVVCCIGCGPSAEWKNAEEAWIRDRKYTAEYEAKAILDETPLRNEVAQLEKQIADIEKTLAAKGASQADYDRVQQQQLAPFLGGKFGEPLDAKLEAKLKEIESTRNLALGVLPKKLEKAKDELQDAIDIHNGTLDGLYAENNKQRDWLRSLIQAGQNGGITREQLNSKAVAAIREHLIKQNLPMPERFQTWQEQQAAK